MTLSKTDQEQAKTLSGAEQVMQNKWCKTSVQNKCTEQKQVTSKNAEWSRTTGYKTEW